MIRYLAWNDSMSHPDEGCIFVCMYSVMQVTLHSMERKLIGAALRSHLFSLPFSWVGSKAKMLDVILPNIPEHKHYVEPFCGTAIVYLYKPLAKLNTLNDIDKNIVGFFRVLQDRVKTQELIRRLRYTPWARSEYRKACLLLSSGREIDDVSRAWAFFVAQCMGMRKSYYADPHGEKFGFACRHRDANKGYLTFMSKVRRILDNAEKLRQCQILNDDGVDVMKRLDNEDVFMFVDPPYLSTTLRSKSKIYAATYDDELHYRLLDFVLSAKSKIMIASYPNELYNKLLDYGWVRIDKVKHVCAGYYTPTKRKQTKRTESLYLNYQLPTFLPSHHVATQSLPLS